MELTGSVSGFRVLEGCYKVEEDVHDEYEVGKVLENVVDPGLHPGRLKGDLHRDDIGVPDS